MEKNELQKIWELPSKLPYRERVEEIQRMFTNDNKNLGVEIRDGGEKVLYPNTSKYNHYFSDGLYVREMFIQGGYFGFTAIHNLANPLFVMKGVMWCTTEHGVQKLVAPTFVLTEAGTKRICWFPEDSVVVTVHPNPDGTTDIDKIEKQTASGTWDQYGEDKENGGWELFEHKEYHEKLNMNKTNKGLIKNKKL
jgi:hypothetical protein|tara:strand:+ start:6811 stop:7392 length:582 start_codon:yes stop_codon:yes gene_type:complete